MRMKIFLPFTSLFYLYVNQQDFQESLSFEQIQLIKTVRRIELDSKTKHAFIEDFCQINDSESKIWLINSCVMLFIRKNDRIPFEMFFFFIFRFPTTFRDFSEISSSFRGNRHLETCFRYVHTFRMQILSNVLHVLPLSNT